MIESRESATKNISSTEITDQKNMSFKSRPGGLIFIDIEEGRHDIEEPNTIAIHTHDRKTDAWPKKIQIPLKESINFFSTLVMNNKLFVVGGIDDYDHERNDIECFDLDALKWISRSHMHEKRLCSELAELDGQLCIYRGYNSDTVLKNEIELYNPTTGEIIELNPPYRSAYNKMSTCKGILYLIELNEGVLQIYDSCTRNWTQRRIPGQSVSFIRCVGFVADENYLYFPDGYSDKGVKRYDLKKRAWKEGFINEIVDYQHIKTMILNNKIVISRNPGGELIFEEYDPKTNTWTKFNKGILGIKNVPSYFNIGSNTA